MRHLRRRHGTEQPHQHEETSAPTGMASSNPGIWCICERSNLTTSAQPIAATSMPRSSSTGSMYPNRRLTNQKVRTTRTNCTAHRQIAAPTMPKLGTSRNPSATDGIAPLMLERNAKSLRSSRIVKAACTQTVARMPSPQMDRSRETCVAEIRSVAHRQKFGNDRRHTEAHGQRGEGEHASAASQHAF